MIVEAALLFILILSMTTSGFRIFCTAHTSIAANKAQGTRIWMPRHCEPLARNDGAAV
jgi:hypothetical protein